MSCFTNFYEYATSLLQHYYLSPLDGIAKNNPRDGVITREIHGVMHVVRAQFYVLFFDQIMHRYCGTHRAKCLSFIQEVLGLTEAHTILLIRYAVLLHDSGRKGEGEDLWEDDSANNLYYFLRQQEDPEYIAQCFAQAIRYKDRKDDYIEFLKNYWNDDEYEHRKTPVELFDYIRQLVYLADCLDIIRCVEEFKIEKLYQELLAYVDVDVDVDVVMREVIALTIHVSKMIETQGDMLFSSKIIGPDGSKIYTSTGGFSLTHKVGFEHASDPLQKTARTMQQHLPKTFCEALNTELTEMTSVAQPTPKATFNPYIHGTTSASLLGLRLTYGKLMSLQNMLTEYGRVPYTGELSGGISHPLSNCMPCFARMIRPGSETSTIYCLDKVLTGYALSKNYHAYDDLLSSILAEITSLISHNRNFGFLYLNQAIVYVVRLRYPLIKLRPQLFVNFYFHQLFYKMPIAA